MLKPAQLDLIYKAWPGVKTSDMYSCVEIGNLAHQCPEYHHYHVNMEHVYLEVVDDVGKPCAVHEAGRVLVTSLLNYATPLIRYELGDYARLGAPCPCGRGLPVLESIVGRARHRLVLPSGASCFPYLGEREDIQAVVPLRLRKFQFVQHTPERIEIKVVTPDRVTHEQEQKIKALYQKNFGFPFEFDITYHEDISPGPTGKFDEFVSLVQTKSCV